MTRQARTVLVPAVLALTACAAPPAEEPAVAPAQLTLEPCHFDGLDEELRCGTLSVFEDRAARKGRKIDLNVVVVPALSDDPAPDPIFFFEGGPGGAAAENPAQAVMFLGALRQRRDLVMVDQRGTGRSHRLDCDVPGGPDDIQGYFEKYLPVDRIEACRDELSEKADLELYTTAIAMDDIDEVRQALGYGQINLMGGSYGTRAAQVYMRRHPEQVRTATLLGVAAMHQHLPLFHAPDAQRSMEMMFDACAADAVCAEAFPDFAAELTAVMERLRESPVEVRVPHPGRDEPATVTLTPGPFAEGLRFLLYGASTAVTVPYAVHRAAAGDFDLLTRMILAVQIELRNAMSFGMHLSVVCAEDRPFFPADVEPTHDGTFLGGHRVQQILDACEVWPRGDIPAGYHQPVTVDAPTLLISGALDPVTPPRWADEVAAHLPSGLHVVVEHAHHSPGGLANFECFLDLMSRFVDAASVAGLDTSCVDTMTRGPFVTDASALEGMLQSFEAQIRMDPEDPT